jgi:hypothetical protein
MRKSDKKIDNNLRVSLTEVCDAALKEVHGFVWLTHRVNYDKFPESLRVICVFDSNENLSLYKENESQSTLKTLINKALKELSINIKSIAKPIEFDSEENCQHLHGGNWQRRLG